MKYFRLVWSGLWRKKARTIFTLLSIVVAFALFGILQGIDTTFKQVVERGRLNVLVTRNPAGLPLPMAQLAQIEAVKGVRSVTYEGLMLGYFRALTNIVVVLPIEGEHFFDMNQGQMVVAPAQLAAFRNNRTGALITRALAQRVGWKIGDHVPINAIIAPRRDGQPWTFDIVGYVDMPDNPARDQSLLLMNYAYFDLGRATDTGTVLTYIETIADARQGPVIANAIDNVFANSSHRTHTETERAYAQSAIAQLGDLDFFVDAVVGATFATLLLLTGTTWMQSYRERIHELAVMKTIGYTDGGVAGLVVSEAILLSLVAALLGLLLAQGVLGAIGSVAGVLPSFHVPRSVFAAGIGAAVGVALVSSLTPALRARRLSIVNALAAR